MKTRARMSGITNSAQPWGRTGLRLCIMNYDNGTSIHPDPVNFRTDLIPIS